MTFGNSKPFVAKSVDQMQREYMETPFKLRNFYNGSQFTIVEDRLKKIPLRTKTELSHKTNKPYSVYLIKVNDGYITKDLSLFDEEVIILFRTLPESIINIKNVTFANENGKWIFICQKADADTENFPKSQAIAASMEPTPASTDIGNQIRALHAAMQTNQATRIFNSVKVTMDLAEKARPGDALNLIAAAKREGWIRDITEAGVSGYRAE